MSLYALVCKCLYCVCKHCLLNGHPDENIVADAVFQSALVRTICKKQKWIAHETEMKCKQQQKKNKEQKKIDSK